MSDALVCSGCGGIGVEGVDDEGDYVIYAHTEGCPRKYRRPRRKRQPRTSTEQQNGES